ncbi:MAG: DUF2029 domain-containing protein [Bdellovibrionaceae bacterium]|nr:DUF2029 domain-containing protein [Pseudobdellovibrionaceae bacterium]
MILCASGLALHLDRPGLAGFIYALLFYKPQLLPAAALFLLAAGQFRFFFMLAASATAWLAVGLLLCGAQAHLAWLQSLQNMMAGLQYLQPGLNQSWKALLESAGLPAAMLPSPLFSSLSLMVPFLAGLRWRHRHSSPPCPARGLFLAMAIGLVVSPYVAHYDFLLVLPWIFTQRIPNDCHSAPTSPFLLPWAGAALAFAGVYSGLPLGMPLLTLWLALTWRAEFRCLPLSQAPFPP